MKGGGSDGIGKWSMPEDKAIKEHTGYSSEWNQECLLVKRDQIISPELYFIIATTDKDVNTSNGFYMFEAEEMLLCYQINRATGGLKFQGKIEFSQNGRFINWICAPGFGNYCLEKFVSLVIKARQLETSQFIIYADPSEQKGHVLRRIKFYFKKMEQKFDIVDVGFKAETGGFWFLCEFKI